MCEYCLNNWYFRNSYDLKNHDDNYIKMSLFLDGEDALKIDAEWIHEHTLEKSGLSALAIIRYCPWCGRKLKNKGEKNDYNY